MLGDDDKICSPDPRIVPLSQSQTPHCKESITRRNADDEEFGGPVVGSPAGRHVRHDPPGGMIAGFWKGSLCTTGILDYSRR
jgi:hypothetical protein